MTRIVLGVETPEIAEEVMHYLDRTGRARVVATAGDERQVQEAVRQLEPDAVVASPGLLGPGCVDGAVLFALDTRESVAALRSAIRAGARGFYLWPVEREELAGAAARVRAAAPVGERRASIVAVLGARGGSGTTFIATHLAAAFGRAGRECVLVDMDPLYADATAALGVSEGEEVRTIADLAPLAEELGPEHLDEVLWPHPEGFRALLAPTPEAWRRVGAPEYGAALRVLAAGVDVIVVQIPRSLDDVARSGLELADRVLLVLTLDVLSFRDAKRVLGLLTELGLRERVEFVVNRASRAEITPGDVRRVFGRSPVATLPADSNVPAAQDRGRLLRRRARTARTIAKLAARLEQSG